MMRIFDGFEYVIIYNGELYNTKNLRDELISRGYFFSSSSDTEVLLVSYIEWGQDCVLHLNGIYAFGIWDGRYERLFLGRDRFGVKPLFYTIKESSFIFGSEIKALLSHPYVNSEVGEEGLAEIFALGPARTPGHAIFNNIYELKPAFCAIYNQEGFSCYKYWSLESKPHTDNIKDTVEKVYYLVKDAIERQTVADVPVCTFLSGGLDSSAITAIAADYFKNNGKEQLHTYSIDFTGNESYFKPSDFQPTQDAPFINLVSQKYNTLHHNITYDTPQLVDSLKSAVIARDLPGMADIDSSLLLFCRDIKKKAKVAISGECADEIFGGYPWFYRNDLINSGTFPWATQIEERTNILSEELLKLINPVQYIKRRYEETLREVPRLPGENPIEARRREIFYLNITWFMSVLLERKDRMSMASGLEVRVPFCDHLLVEYLWNVPWEMKAYGGMEKGILRCALKDILPDEILKRKKSPYPKTYNPSYESAVKHHLTEILNDPNSPIKPFINIDRVLLNLSMKSDCDKPWFGQLMTRPQLFAYLIQINMWLKEYKIRIAA